MKKLYPLVLLLLIGCKSKEIQNIVNKELVTVDGTIEKGFNGLRISDGIEVELRQAMTNDYSITADESIVNDIRFEVVDSVLNIYAVQEIKGLKKVEVFVKASQVDHITLTHNSKLRVDGEITSEAFTIEGRDNSKFEIDLDTKSLVINLLENSGGKLSAKGETMQVTMNGRTDLKGDFQFEEVEATLRDTAEFTLDGSAEDVLFSLDDGTTIDAQDYSVTHAEVTLATRAKAKVNVSKNLTIYAKDRSIIEVHGGAAINVKKLDDKAKIVKK